MSLDDTLVQALSAIKPYLGDVVLAGGWVPSVYAQVQAPLEEGALLTTRDIDVALPRRLGVRTRTIGELTQADASRPLRQIPFSFGAALTPRASLEPFSPGERSVAALTARKFREKKSEPPVLGRACGAITMTSSYVKRPGQWVFLASAAPAEVGRPANGGPSTST